MYFDKEKQKEQIMLIVKNAICSNAHIDFDCDCIQLDGNDVDHVATEIAETLYSTGYRPLFYKS